MTIQSLIKKYEGNIVEDWGVYTSDSAKGFARNIKATIKEIAKNNNAELISFTIGHYFISGFIKKDNKFVYFSFDIERGEQPIELNSNNFMKQFLIRTASNEKDYTGGRNHYSTLNNFEKMMNMLLI